MVTSPKTVLHRVGLRILAAPASSMGHIWRNCALSSRGQPHLNVFTFSGECPVTDAHGADTIVIPQQQHHQPAVDLGREDIPFQQSSAWQQQLDLQHNGGVVETSGAPGGGGRGDGEDGSGLLSGTFLGGDGGAVEEWLQLDNMEMPMFSLSEGPQQSAPTAVALPAAAPAAEAVTDTRVFPAVSSKGVAEAPTSSSGAASAAVPAVAPATGGTVFRTASVGGAARVPASAYGTAVLTAAPTTSGTIPSAAPIRVAVGARESSAGAVSSDAAAEAVPSTCDTAAPDASVARAARKFASAAGSSSEICGERGASTHPFDPGTVFPLEVRYYNGSWLMHGSSSSGNSSSSSSNDNTSNHDSWRDATCVGALLRPFDAGKRCRWSARRGKVVLGVDLPFGRGNAWRRMQHGG